MEKKDKEIQKEYLELQILSQRIGQLHQQIKSITNSIVELKSIENSLEEIKKLKKENKILIPLGGNVFIKGEIKKCDELIVGIGSKILVKKNILDTKGMIKNQISELEDINIELEKETNDMVMQFEDLQKGILKE